MAFDVYSIKNEYIRRLFIIILISRPVHMFFSILLFLSGFFYVGAEIDFYFFLMIFLLILFNHITYGLNDIYDYDSDKSNPRKGFLHGIFLKKKYQSMIKKSVLVSFIIILFCLFFYNYYTIIVFLLLLLMAYTYSCPPFFFKRRFLTDIVYNGVGYFLLFVLGFSFSGNLDVPSVFYWFILFIAGLTFHTQMGDYESDKKAGYNNTPIVLGKRGSAIFAFMCFFISILFVDFQTSMANYFLYFVCFMMFVLIFIVDKRKLLYIHLYSLYLGILFFILYFLIVWIPKFV